MKYVCALLVCLVFCGASVAQQPASTSSATQSESNSSARTSSQERPPSAQSPASASGTNASNGPNATPQSESTKQSKERTQEQTKGTSNDRLFWTLPNFLTVKTKEIPPLTTGQKFKVVARGTFDPVEYFYIGFLAGISQASDSEPGFGQGAAGYGKRYASAFADNAIENFMTGAVLPSLLKQDPRFYQSGKGGFGRRTGYAVSRIFITRSDSGHSQFNFSEVGGSAISAGISTFSYHPREDRNIGNAVSVWGTQVGWDTVTIVFKEFWPDIHRKFSKKKAGSASELPAQGGEQGAADR